MEKDVGGSGLCLFQGFSNCGALPGDATGPLGRGDVECMRDKCILNEICAQDKIYILVDTLLG
jgi:hypothetical protein